MQVLALRRRSGSAGSPAGAPCRRSGRAGSASGGRRGESARALSRPGRPPPRAGVLPGARPVRFATRKMCVSTAIVGSPKAVLSTTLAVLRPTPGQCLERGPVPRHLAAVPVEQDPAGAEDVPCLGVEQADGPDVLLQPGLAERQDRRRRAGHREQAGRRLVHADVRGLGGQDHGDEQFEGSRGRPVRWSVADWPAAGAGTGPCVAAGVTCHRSDCAAQNQSWRSAIRAPASRNSAPAGRAAYQ